MIKVAEGRQHGSYHCSSCGLPKIDLETMGRVEEIPLWHISIGRPETHHTSTSVLCWGCMLSLHDQMVHIVWKERNA